MRLKPSGGAGTTAGPPVRRNHGLKYPFIDRRIVQEWPALCDAILHEGRGDHAFIRRSRRYIDGEMPKENGRQCPIVLVILLQSRSFHCVHHIENALVHVEILI